MLQQKKESFIGKKFYLKIDELRQNIIRIAFKNIFDNKSIHET